MRVAVTSLVRHARASEPSGFLSVVDLAVGRVISRHAVPESAHRANDPNPRGGVRGAKGVYVHGDRLVIANSERLFVFEPGWELEREITHPWFGQIHDLLAGEDGIYVTCAGCDLLAHVGWDGSMQGSWCWRSDAGLKRELGLEGVVPPFDRSLDYRDPQIAHTGIRACVHLNSVARTRDGLLLSFGRIPSARKLRAFARRSEAAGLLGARAIAAVRRIRALRLAATRAPVEIVRGARSARLLLPSVDRPARILHLAEGAGAPTHNVAQAGPLLVYNDSAARALTTVDRSTGSVVHRVPVPGTPAFPRGLARWGNDVWLVGSQRPAAVHAIDLEERRVLSSVEIGGRDTESVFAITTLPEEFAEPPPRLWANRGVAALA